MGFSIILANRTIVACPHTLLQRRPKGSDALGFLCLLRFLRFHGLLRPKGLNKDLPARAGRILSASQKTLWLPKRDPGAAFIAPRGLAALSRPSPVKQPASTLFSRFPLLAKFFCEHDARGHSKSQKPQQTARGAGFVPGSPVAPRFSQTPYSDEPADFVFLVSAVCVAYLVRLFRPPSRAEALTTFCWSPATQEARESEARRPSKAGETSYRRTLRT